METHQVRHGRCQNDDAFRNFNFANAQLIYCEYRPHRKPSKHVALPPTLFLPHDNHRNMRIYAVTSQLLPRLGQMHCHYLVHWHWPRQSHLRHGTLPSPYRRLEKSLYVGGFHVILGTYTPGSRRIPAVEPLVA